MDERYDIPDGIHEVIIQEVRKVIKDDHKAVLFVLKPTDVENGLIFHYQLMTPKGRLTKDMIKKRRDIISDCFAMDFSSNPITDEMFESYEGRRGKIETFHNTSKDGNIYVNVKQFKKRFDDMPEPKNTPKPEPNPDITGDLKQPQDMQFASIEECPF